LEAGRNRKLSKPSGKGSDLMVRISALPCRKAPRSMSDEDAEAIATYLKSVPPTHHSVPRAESESRIFASTSPLRPAEPAASETDTVAHGRYIVHALAHCTQCHNEQSESVDASAQHLDRDARIFRGPWGAVVAPSIAPDALRDYSDAQLATTITKGLRPDGSSLVGPMPVAAYAGLKPEDVASIVAYLHHPHIK
jgi:mono/diheme cytochrome c family protein